MTARGAAHFGDALEIYGRLPASSYRLIMSDGPYGIGWGGWDPSSPRMLPGVYASHLAAWWRLSMPSSWLAMWGTPEGCARMLAPVEATGWARAARIVWAKPFGTVARNSPASFRAWPEMSEECWIYGRKGVDPAALAAAGIADDGLRHRSLGDVAGASERNTVRAYLVAEWAAAGLTVRDAIEATGKTTASHYFSRGQWAMPTREHYAAMQRRANEHLRRDFEDLRRDFEHLRRDFEDLRRDFDGLRAPFSWSPDLGWDVWRDAPEDAPERHPAAKPLELIERLVLAHTLPGELVLEPFGGGAPTLRACVRLGRDCDSIEQDPAWHERACMVLATERPGARQGQMF